VQNLTNPVSLSAFHFMWDINFLLDAIQYFFIIQTIGPTDLLYPSLAPHFKRWS